MQDNIKVTMANTCILMPRGSLIIDCFTRTSMETGQKIDTEIIAARTNNEFVSLMDTVFMNCLLEPVYFSETAGTRIYKDSLIFLFAMAAHRVFPNRSIAVGHSMGHGMLFHFQDNGPPATNENTRDLKRTMLELVQQDLAITPNRISWEDAVEYFQKQNRMSTALLLRERNELCIETWHCGDYTTLRYAPLISRTGAYYSFTVDLFDDGFLLGYTLPNQEQVADNSEDPLYKVYKEHRKWGQILGLSNVSSLNNLVRNRREAKDFIRTSEALQDRKMGELAGSIAAKNNQAIMIAGPSSSGKTTFTKKLALNLKSLGRYPQLISLDDYYKKEKDIPLDMEGNPDYEALESLDIELLNESIQGLLAGKEVEIPHYDFKSDANHAARGRKIRIGENGIILFEGLHGLNPNLIPNVDKSRILRIYLSPLAQLNVDDYVRIPLTDNRLLRRIVRDHHFRGCTASVTLNMWPSVRRGEEQYVFPWQGSADYLFDTALDYEIAVLKVFAEPLLHTVSPNEKKYGEARRLLSLLKNFSPSSRRGCS